MSYYSSTEFSVFIPPEPSAEQPQPGDVILPCVSREANLDEGLWGPSEISFLGKPRSLFFRCKHCYLYGQPKDWMAGCQRELGYRILHKNRLNKLADCFDRLAFWNVIEKCQPFFEPSNFTCYYCVRDILRALKQADVRRLRCLRCSRPRRDYERDLLCASCAETHWAEAAYSRSWRKPLICATCAMALDSLKAWVAFPMRSGRSGHRHVSLDSLQKLTEYQDRNGWQIRIDCDQFCSKRCAYLYYRRMEADEATRKRERQKEDRCIKKARTLLTASRRFLHGETQNLEALLSRKRVSAQLPI